MVIKKTQQYTKNISLSFCTFIIDGAPFCKNKRLLAGRRAISLAALSMKLTQRVDYFGRWRKAKTILLILGNSENDVLQ